MENTVVGVYDSYAQAQAAISELVASGFPRDAMQLNPEQQMEAGEAEFRSEGDSFIGHGSGIAHFFRSLFGMADDARHTDIYAEAVRRGSVVLVVSVDNEVQRDLVVDVMNRHDPVDLDERSGNWIEEGWSGYDAAAPSLTDDEIAEDRNRYAQRAVNADGQAPRTGARAFRRVEETSDILPLAEEDVIEQQFVDADGAGDDDFRRHWQSAYAPSGGRYEDYDSAYRYGSRMAGSERYRDYRWDDIEPDMRVDWETTHPESTWDKVKDAVRYGVERVRRSPGPWH